MLTPFEETEIVEAPRTMLEHAREAFGALVTVNLSTRATLDDRRRAYIEAVVAFRILRAEDSPKAAMLYETWRERYEGRS